MKGASGTSPQDPSFVFEFSSVFQQSAANLRFFFLSFFEVAQVILGATQHSNFLGFECTKFPDSWLVLSQIETIHLLSNADCIVTGSDVSAGH